MNDKPNHEERAYRAWCELTRAAGERRLLRYNEIGDALGIHHRAVGFALDPIHRYCMRENLPPLSILVVNKTGLPGKGFTAWEAERFGEGSELVFNYPWEGRPNPFRYAATGARIEELATELMSTADPEEMYTRVKDRGTAQELFRQVMLRTYRSRCAVCEFPIVEALDAAHLKPWFACSHRERLDPANGVLLCRNHHALLDAGLITVATDGQLRVNRAKLKSDAINELDGLMLLHPASPSTGPGIEYLRWHREHIAGLDE